MTATPRRTARVSRNGVLLAAGAAFAAITAARFAVDNPADAVGVLFVLPIAGLALALGWRAGVAGAVVALALTGAWDAIADVGMGITGYVTRAVAFVGMAGLVGLIAEQRDRVRSEATRWFSMSNDLLCMADTAGILTRVNHTWTQLLGYDEGELLGRPFTEFVHPDDVERTREAAAVLAGASTVAGFENRYLARDGTWHWLLWSARSDGRHVFAVAKDITERKALEDERNRLIADLREASRTDELTGLPNRRAWNEQLIAAITHAARFDEPLSVAWLDLDDFKSLNDTHGHAAGDRLLKDVAAAWTETLRAADFLGRLGGDEFAVILPGCPPSERHHVAERLRSALPPGHEVSVGIVTWDGEEPLHELLKRADEALYDAKPA